MKIKVIKTKKILANQLSTDQFLNEYIKTIKDNSIIVITSKIISLMENRIASKELDKEFLIKDEADHISAKRNCNNRLLTIKHNAFISGAGIDESNGNGDYILLPKNPQNTAKKIYEYLSKKYNKTDFGVIITDSRSLPLRCGVLGVAIGFYGFSPLKSYIGKEDIFGRKLQFERVNIVDGLAVTAVLAMGEGSEQTPLAIIEDADFVTFNKNKPSKKDLDEFYVSLADDIFSELYQDFKR
ncbi:TPA: putative folate metabolism gamma-glutamate ligase [Candidatus Berkelbacteria bacterium]|uniref:Coenzyme F420:L-glutamate ligase-like domain-containing protein n=1 Tax=Berkelbacteria bacterium GW2011_GWE1_39_12 TaxID=1618337 RepID=A0A0G4B382_9BACT|nr:MAG: hypothetical protein UT28_C0001G0059 [Berkelbacteria bacterium GW2011_GWE1_39_12]HBO60450.1 putative folate metabolism gamma-glutamate ligase [Candidatus Berkelbacteria bacterium]